MQVGDRHTRRRQIRGRDAGARYMGAADGDNYQRNFLKFLAIVIDRRYATRAWAGAGNFREKILIFAGGNPYNMNRTHPTVLYPWSRPILSSQIV